MQVEQHQYSHNPALPQGNTSYFSELDAYPCVVVGGDISTRIKPPQSMEDVESVIASIDELCNECLIDGLDDSEFKKEQLKRHREAKRFKKIFDYRKELGLSVNYFNKKGKDGRELLDFRYRKRK
jgi:hypothetical protein